MIMEKKIRVQYLPPADAGQPHKSPSPPPYAGSDSVKHEESLMETPNIMDTKSQIKGADSSVRGETQIPIGKSLADQLAAANAQIAELRAQLTDPQLRQRKLAEVKDDVKAKASSAVATARAQRTEGVPVQLAAALCLAAFLLAYFFF